jgi:Xaa-Pro dipeptidase
MQVATDITIAAYRHTYRAGQSRHDPGGDIGALMNSYTASQGARVSFNLILVGEGSAYPHGSKKPQVVARARSC